MDLQGWDQRYRSGERAFEDLEAAPTPLLIQTARGLKPGRALDLACGAGRNALWLAQAGWTVTAVDGAPSAIEILKGRAAALGLSVDAKSANLENHEYSIAPASWDLILFAYYLQRDLFEPAKQGVVPGGIILAIVHLGSADRNVSTHSLKPGELRAYFEGWELLHDYEGSPVDPAHRHTVAEVVARRPATGAWHAT